MNSSQRIGFGSRFSIIKWIQFLHKVCLIQERTAVAPFLIKINVLVPEMQICFLNLVYVPPF